MTVEDPKRSAEFYLRIFGGETVRSDEPTIIQIVNSWLVFNIGGDPTDDKPAVTLRAPQIGSSSTKSGIFDYLFEYRPRYFIIDELEKMNKKDQTSLLNLMESGILSELKHNLKRSTQLKTWVFASCNTTDKLLPPLLTRFRDIHFKPYTEEEFVEIVVNVLDREEGVDRDIALLIADSVYDTLKSTNIR